jgi:hypothetical protein
MAGGYDERITKRMIGRRHLTGDISGKARKGGKAKADGEAVGEGNAKGKSNETGTVTGTGKGKGKSKCKPKPNPAHPGAIESQFLVTGPCTDEITPQCIRGKQLDLIRSSHLVY